MSKGKPIPFTRYPIRTCKSVHGCEICKGDITYGQKYYDGGYGRRAHDLCADAEELERTETAKFVAATVDFYKDDDEP